MSAPLYALSSAKIAALYEEPWLTPGRLVALFVGLIFVLVGAIDILSRLPLWSPDAPHASAAALPRPSESVRASFIPLRLVAPSIGVDAAVEQVGLNAAGNMAVPSGYKTVAWYKNGAAPGEAGTTVIAGHLNNSLGLAGVFENLNQLQLGDTVQVVGENAEARYVVREITVYGAHDAPVKDIFSTGGLSRLVLITCDGAWDKGARSYDKRLVVTLELQ